MQGETLTRLASAAQMSGRIRLISSEATQIDELIHSRAGREPRNVLCPLAVSTLEVTSAERVNEIVGDVRASSASATPSA